VVPVYPIRPRQGLKRGSEMAQLRLTCRFDRLLSRMNAGNKGPLAPVWRGEGSGKNYLPLVKVKTSTMASVEEPLPAGEEQVMVTVFV
jgi:hypothetical protein